MNGARVTKIVKEIKFEGVWGKLEAKKCFERQPFTNCVKRPRVTKIVKEIKFEGVLGELEVKACFQRQPFTKYLSLTLVSM